MDENNASKYNSQELDKETGFYYYNARHYAPQIARFVTPDTAIDVIHKVGEGTYYFSNGDIYKGHWVNYLSVAKICGEIIITQSHKGTEN